MTAATLAVPFDPPRRYVPANLAAIAGLIFLLLAGLPLAVWLDLRNLSEHSLHSQADELGAAINAAAPFSRDDSCVTLTRSGVRPALSVKARSAKA